MTGSDRFQVDLHGIVDLLAQHIYSSPRVFVRELLQNAVDAVTARRVTEPDAPAQVRILADGESLVVDDTGIGLTADQVAEVLATIGRSTKRDQIGLPREEFLGQFGVGLLSAFMVAEQIQVVTRASAGPTTEWVGRADGSYTTREVGQRSEIGTTVTLVPRPEARPWFVPETVERLVAHFGRYLEVDVTVNGSAATVTAPWAVAGGPGARRAALTGYAQDDLGFTPFDVFDLSVPEVGLVGAAFVVPYTVNPTEKGTNRVYLKRMLLGDNVEGLLPDWAYFVRCLVDTSGLRPVASREGLMDDDALELARASIGAQVKRWIVRVGTTDPARMARFIATHHLGLKALAVHDDEMLELVDRWVPFETNLGRMTMSEFRSAHGEIALVETVETFRQVAPVAAAQGIALVNGGYTYDVEVLERLAARAGSSVRRFDPSDLAVSLRILDPAEERAMGRVLDVARRALVETGSEVVVREFEPPTLPVLYLVDRSAAFSSELRSTRDRVDGLWSQVLGALETTQTSAPQVVLNHLSPLVRRLATLDDEAVVRFAVEGLYGQALMAGQHPVRPADTAILNRSFVGLLERALGEEEQR